MTAMRQAGTVPLASFLAGVAERARVDVDAARIASEAVLATLGDWIAGAAVESLISQLPIALRPALRRCAAEAGTTAAPLPADEFVYRVSERCATPLADARVLVRAVLTTMRDAIRTESFDGIDHLPEDYRHLLAPMVRHAAYLLPSASR